MADAVTLVVKIVSDVKSATSGMDEVASRGDKMKAGLSTAAKAATGVLLGLGAAAVVAGNAAAEDAQSQAILATSLAKATGASKAQIAATEDWISAQSLATGIADDQLRPALGALARSTGDVASAQDALGVAMDVSVATGKDLQSVSEAMAKAYAGNTTSLGKLVPGMDKAVLASGDMNAILAEMSSTMGGSAAAAADTAAGQMQIMTVQMDEAKEAIGAGLLPVMAKFAEMLTKVATFAGEHPKLFQAIAIAVALVAGAIILLNIAVGVYTSVMTIAGAVAAVSWMAILGPILLVIAAVAAVGVIIFLIVKHWDTLKAAALTAWGAILGGIQAAFGWIKSNWPTILAVLTGPIGIAVLLIVKNWEKIKSALDTATAAMKTIWNATVAAIKSAVSGLGDILSKPFDVVESAVSAVKTAVASITTAVGNLIGKVTGTGGTLSAPFNAMKTAADAVSSAIGAVVSAVQNLIDKIANIHWPKIPKFPHIPGTSSATATRSVSTAGLYAAPAVRTPVSRAVSSSGGVTINVTGAIDPEATARQIQRILSGHTRRVGLVS